VSASERSYILQSNRVRRSYSERQRTVLLIVFHHRQFYFEIAEHTHYAIEIEVTSATGTATSGTEIVVGAESKTPVK